jgi:two-component system cell cycle sensor histidine kinase/response regulator CckA
MLQLGVAAYALRLNRLFGASRVGWALFSAFALLATLRFIETSGIFIIKFDTRLQVEWIYALISLLLLIGMIHIEQVFKERLRADNAARRTRSELEDLVKERTAELVKANEELRQEAVRAEEHEKALQQSQQQYRFLFQENPQPMWVFDRESFVFLAVNNAALRDYGFSLEEFQALTAINIHPAQDIPAFLEDAAKTSSGVEARGVWRHSKKDGKLADVEVAVTDFSYNDRPARLVLATDTTERQVLEKQLRQSQKMEAIGQLAGGVAHDFNNILTVIQGYADLMLRRQLDADIKDQLEQIGAASRRAASLTRQLLAFSRRNFMQVDSVRLNAVVDNLTKMLRRLIGEDIVLETTYGSNLPPISGDATMVEQVIMNLTVNARDAMPNGGNLGISTALFRVDAPHVQRHQEARLGDFVCLTVRDSGYGMTPEVVSHLFEPFFTTKDIGKGTGLGLATIYGIVRQHSGWIEVDTAVGLGTQFKVYFPAAPRSAMDAAKSSELPPAPGGRETILLVEDEEAVRGLARLILNQSGYKVFEADCGAAALDIWAERASQIDLVLTDMVMPGGISGRALAETLRQTRPDLKVVYTSGYSPSKSGQDPSLLDGLKFLPKPYNPDKLVRAVQDCLTDGTNPRLEEAAAGQSTSC